MPRGRQEDAPLATAEARRELPRLAEEFGRYQLPSATLAARAVAVGRYRRPTLLMVPLIDADAATAREREQSERIAILEEVIEDLLLDDFITTRGRDRTRPTSSLEEAAAALGLSDVLDEKE